MTDNELDYHLHSEPAVLVPRGRRGVIWQEGAAMSARGEATIDVEVALSCWDPQVRGWRNADPASPARRPA